MHEYGGIVVGLRLYIWQYNIRARDGIYAAYATFKCRPAKRLVTKPLKS